MVTALMGSAAEAWIRVAANDPTPIKLALDTGAQHIVVLIVSTKKIVAKGFPIGSFAVTPAQGVAALEAGCQLLFLGFDVMFVPAAVQLYLAQLQNSAS